jgi:hypothetical protein
MNLLVAYDRARAAIAEAKTVKATCRSATRSITSSCTPSRSGPRAAGGCDRAAAADCERHLGAMLEAAARRPAICAQRASRGKAAGAMATKSRPATLKEIGVDKKLSATSRRAAALDDAEFEAIVAMRARQVKSGGAILIDPVKAACQDIRASTRAAPPCRPHHQRRINRGSRQDGARGPQVRLDRLRPAVEIPDPLGRRRGPRPTCTTRPKRSTRSRTCRSASCSPMTARSTCGWSTGARRMRSISWRITACATSRPPSPGSRPTALRARRYLGRIHLAHRHGLLDPRQSRTVLARHQGQSEAALCRRAPADRRAPSWSTRASPTPGSIASSG